MFGYAPRLPVVRDPQDGFALTKSVQETVKQNLKNLVLTSPGERIMDPSFGVGIRAWLFQQSTPTMRDQIREEIFFQTDKYMPFVTINEVRFGEDEQLPEKLYIQIEYSIAGLNAVDILQLSVVL
jgi:hypothetical protein